MAAQACDPDKEQEDQELQDQAGLHETVSKRFKKRKRQAGFLSESTTMPT